ncbi:FUSC family protein [Stenotrophomonas sepilia]
MTALAESRLRLLTTQIAEDIRPETGRFALTLRIAAMCALMALLAMMFELQEPAISCYLIIFMVKPDAISSMVIALGAIVVVTLIAPVLVILTVWTVDVPQARMLVILVSSLMFLYLGSASKLGEGGGVVALVIAFYMSLLSYVPLAEIVSRGVVDAWLMVVVPMVVMLLFNLYAGSSSAAVLRGELAQRLEAAAAMAEGTPGRPSGAGQSELQLTATLINALAGAPKPMARWLAGAVDGTCRLRLAVSALPATLDVRARESIATACRCLRDTVLRNEIPDPHGDTAVLGDADPAVIEVRAALEALRQPRAVPVSPPPRSGFLAFDAFSNPAHVRYAIKATTAAMICYLIYTALDWQGIHTAMITCYVASLGTAGETVHKLALRIAGCLLGAAMGAFALIYVMPQIETIGGLLVLVLVGMLPAAWVRAGSNRISYAGVQVGLAFLLTVLQGFGPTTDIDTARDRVLGILLGNVVVYLVFTKLWPVPIVQTVAAAITAALTHLERLSTLPHPQREDGVRAAMGADAALEIATQQLELAGFEPRALRPGNAQRRWLAEVMKELSSLTALLFSAPVVTEAQAARLERIATRWRERDCLPSTAPTFRTGAETLDRGEISNTLDDQLLRLEALMDGE